MKKQLIIKMIIQGLALYYTANKKEYFSEDIALAKGYDTIEQIDTLVTNNSANGKPFYGAPLLEIVTIYVPA